MRPIGRSFVKMRGHLLRWVLFVFLVLVNPAFQDLEGATGAFDEYLIKGAFIMNICNFVKWSPTALLPAGTPFTIGILGMNPFDDTLDDLADRTNIQGHKVTVKKYKKISEVMGCQVLFISVSETSKLEEIFKSLKDRPVLTFGDAKEFALKGGMIGLVIENNRVLFEVNKDVAERDHIKIGSDLLNLANSVVMSGKIIKKSSN